MSWSAGIHIRFCQPVRLGGILEVLREAGWGFHDGSVSFELDERLERGPESTWIDIVSLLETGLQSGQKTAVDFYWEGRWDAECGIHITCEMAHCDEMRIFPDASVPCLDGAYPFVDWSWLLNRIVLPLERNAFTIRSVDCSEGR